MEKIGQHIKKIRELRNYTQKYMAEQLEMSQQGYAKIENDETDISFSRLNKIADVLGTRIQEILGFDEKTVFNVNNSGSGDSMGIKNEVPTNLKEVYEALIKSKDEEIAYLRSMIDKLMK